MGSTLGLTMIFFGTRHNQYEKISIFLLVLAMAFPIGASAQSQVGDVNGDGKLSITDVAALINYLLSNDASQIVIENCDVNGDTRITISDVTTLIDILLNQSGVPEPDDDYVDLGLPSGTLWATRNVGADNPDDYGDLFSWGETEPKDSYWWADYKWVEIDANGILSFTKYNTESNQGIVDNKTELDPEDDAACAHYPNGRMPSIDQINELIENCTWEWTKMNNAIGELITGPNGNTIFLPAAGGTSFVPGEFGAYWSRSMGFFPPYYYYPQMGSSIQFSSEYYEMNTSSRCVGMPVRAVKATQE